MKIDLPTHTQQKKKQKFRGFFWVFLLVILGGVSAYLFFINQEITAENQDIKKSIANIQTQIDQVSTEGQSLKSLSESQRILGAAETYRVQWSEVMRAILFYERDNVRFKNFQVDPTGQEVQISAEAKTLQDIKNVLALLKDSPNVAEGFVPVISRQQFNETHPLRFDITFLLTSDT